jgi:hypothetical protein
LAEQRYASPSEVESQADQWSEDFLQCRLYGHPWRPSRATFNSRFRYYYVVQLCPRCLSERHAELNERGHIMASWMKYPEGYLTKKIGRIVGDGRDVLRLAALTRVYDVAKTRKVERPHSMATRRELGID